MFPEDCFELPQIGLFQVRGLLRGDKSQTTDLNLQGIALGHKEDVGAERPQLLSHLLRDGEGDVEESRNQSRSGRDRKNDEGCPASLSPE